MQTDPIGYKDQMNLYAYVGNDPINNRDPSGLWTCNKGAEAQCDVVEQGLKDAAANMKNMNKADATKMGGILKTWGARGQSNHISVASGHTRGAANTSTKNGETTVTINSSLTNDPAKFAAATQHTMASVMVHEGQHIIDERLWGGNPGTKQESFDTESRAMTIEQKMERAQGFTPSTGIYGPIEQNVYKRAWETGMDWGLPGSDPIVPRY